MTEPVPATPVGSEPPRPDPLDTDVLGVEGVTGLTGPTHDDGSAVEVHVGVRYGTPLAALGEQVAAVVARHAPGRAVHVHVDDVA